jgi:cell division protein FtsI (penicillin-binding protein 3)
VNAFASPFDRTGFEPLVERPAPLAVAQQRLMVLMLLFMGLTAVIAGRLVQLCLFPHAARTGFADPNGPRGQILDRNGVPLASTVKLWAVAVNPRHVIGDKNKLAESLAQLMPERTADQYRRILFGRSAFAYLRRPASPELAQAVNALGEPGMELLSESHRLFPQGTLAGHLLGYAQMVATGRSGKEALTGIGVERSFDDQLRAGHPLQLTVDARVQAAMESELARRMAETSAVGAAGVVMDVDTGEVLAMASLPTINPNAPLRSAADANNKDMINKVTLGTYELGSTFKMLTFANAIESGVITDMRQMYDISHPLHVGGFTIHDDEPKHRSVYVPEVMTFSSNIGTALIADQIGGDRIKPFFDKFGFNDRTSIELRERGLPQVPKYWARTTVMTTAYGHGIAVTPLHLAQAYAALANGGVLHPATLIPRDPRQPVPGKRVISETTSARIRQLMRMVVLQGTGTNADAPGLRMGGKTGTAEKVSGHGYTKNANVTVFAGVFPMDHPRYTMVLLLDDAKASKATAGFKTAGWMVAPAGKRIAARIGPLLGIKPEVGHDIDVSDLMPLILDKKVPGKNAID